MGDPLLPLLLRRFNVITLISLHWHKATKGLPHSRWRQRKIQKLKTTRLPADENQFSLRRATNFCVPRRAFDEHPTYLLSFASSGALFPQKNDLHLSVGLSDSALSADRLIVQGTILLATVHR
jgi:hypothetical protein